jgi:hypothetical protein
MRQGGLCFLIRASVIGDHDKIQRIVRGTSGDLFYGFLSVRIGGVDMKSTGHFKRGIFKGDRCVGLEGDQMERQPEEIDRYYKQEY